MEFFLLNVLLKVFMFLKVCDSDQVELEAMVLDYPKFHNHEYCSLVVRGGVEDTRLEAKDTKKIRGQGQGQPFRGQTLSRPRTGMLEAKAKDQGHKAQVLSKKKKKKVFTKIFQAISKKKKKKKKVFAKIFQAISTKKRQKIFQPLHKILTFQKIVLSSSQGQANFRGLEASRPRPRTSKCVLEAKDVLEDSTSAGSDFSLQSYVMKIEVSSVLNIHLLCRCVISEFSCL